MSGLLELRPAHPHDAEFLAWGLDEAAGGLFSTMFGGRSTAILASVMAQTGHQLSYEHAMLATVDGQVKGFCQGWPYGTPSADDELMHAAGLMAVRAAVVVLLGHPVFRALGRHSPGEWYLQAIAVLPHGEAVLAMPCWWMLSPRLPSKAETLLRWMSAPPMCVRKHCTSVWDFEWLQRHDRRPFLAAYGFIGCQLNWTASGCTLSNTRIKLTRRR